MTVEFRLMPHLLEKDRMLVEVWENDVMIGAIYPKDNGLLLIVSKFGVHGESIEGPFPNLEVQIGK